MSLGQAFIKYGPYLKNSIQSVTELNCYYQLMKLSRAGVVGLLSRLGVGLRNASEPGVSFLGRNIYWMSKDSGPKSWNSRGYFALERLLNLQPGNLLDVGAGDLRHSIFAASKGIDVTSVDFGTSVYAEQTKADDIPGNITSIQRDFLTWHEDSEFDAVFASHVLEHQPNPGLFLKCCLDKTKEGGILCIVVPFPEKNLVDGHISSFTPASLAYLLALQGTSLRTSSAFESHGEFALIVEKASFDPQGLGLTYDSGDIQKLAPFLPNFIQPGINSYSYWNELRR